MKLPPAVPPRDPLSRQIADYPIIFDRLAVAHLRSGKKTQFRVLATSFLRHCRPGDRLWVKETFVGGKMADAGRQELFAAPSNAEFVVFPDGWRQFRGGQGCQGAVPTSRAIEWTPEIHLPRWASRTTLRVCSVRTEYLQSIRPEDVLGDILLRSFAGFYWRWPAHPAGVWRDPVLAYATVWNASRGTRGERWQDNPLVVVIDFRVEGR